MLNGDKLVPLDTKKEIEGFDSLAFDSQGRLWAATKSLGIFTYKDGKEQMIRPEEGKLPSGHILSLEVDANDRVWIGFSWGLAVLDGGQKKNLSSVFADTVPKRSARLDSKKEPVAGSRIPFLGWNRSSCSDQPIRTGLGTAWRSCLIYCV